MSRSLSRFKENKAKSKIRLKNIEDVIKFMGNGKDDALLVRNVENPDEFKHWVENYDISGGGEIEISEGLFMDCFDSEYFDFARDIPREEKEFYLRYYGPTDD